MTKIRNTVVALTTAAFLATALSSPASARKGKGFLADLGVITGILTERQADALDKWHEILGNPLDRAAEELLDSLDGDQDD